MKSSHSPASAWASEPILQQITNTEAGDIIVSQLDASAAMVAVEAAHAGDCIFFAHADFAALKAAEWELSARNAAERILFFHGRTQDLQREIPVRPRVAIVRSGEDLMALWSDLPAQALVLVAEPFSAADHWQSEGFLERLPGGNEGPVFVTTARFAPGHTRFPPDLFRTLRTDLLARYASVGGSSASYTPVSGLTRAARDWWLASTPRERGGYEEWPHRREASLSLPQTLPNGERWPLISIVTPTFNQGRFLEETILSVQRQDYPRLEHIVIDGGSTDSTGQILARHRDSFSAFVSEQDRGQSHAINKGMALAGGEILTWLNSDDMLAPGALGAIAMGFSTSKADLVAGMAHLRSGNRTNTIHLTSCEPGPLPLDRLLDLEAGWNAGQFFFQPEVMFSRAAWERAGGHLREDLYYSMDYDLWVRMAQWGARLHVIGRPVAWFRIHEEQKTSEKEKVQSELKEYVDAYCREHSLVPASRSTPATHRASLRIVMLNDHGYQFGAGIAHRRTAESLARAGHDVHALAFRPDPGHRGIPTKLTGEEVLQGVQAINPDLIIAGNIHSASQEAWHLGVLAEQYPVLSVLHDFWMLTGRCSYPKPCEKYLTGCDETCPTADEYPRLDPPLIAGAWEQKQHLLFGDNGLALLANSEWMRKQALETLAARGPGRPHVPVASFRLSFPLDRFRPRDRRASRKDLGLPEDRFLMLLAAPLNDERKRARAALAAAESLGLENLTVVSLGVAVQEESFSVDVLRPGQIDDEEILATYYAAADIAVVPSDQETFGQVFLEAAACGTPAIGVRGSGVQEALIDGVTGILVDEGSPDALAAAILALYRRPDLRAAMGAWSRLYVENEWSPEAAYYHLFQAWRELRWLDRLQLQARIWFRDDVVSAPKVNLLEHWESVTVGEWQMGHEEGPFPELGLPLFRWAFGPLSRIKLQVHNPGRYSLVVRYRNSEEEQQMTLAVNSHLLGNFPLAVTGMREGRVLCVAVDLPAGESVVALGFTRWQDPSIDGRPLAIAITEFAVLPEGREDGG